MIGKSVHLKIKKLQPMAVSPQPMTALFLEHVEAGKACLFILFAL
jgi:hypothetical protein